MDSTVKMSLYYTFPNNRIETIPPPPSWNLLTNDFADWGGCFAMLSNNLMLLADVLPFSTSNAAEQGRQEMKPSHTCNRYIIPILKRQSQGPRSQSWLGGEAWIQTKQCHFPRG